VHRGKKDVAPGEEGCRFRGFFVGGRTPQQGKKDVAPGDSSPGEGHRRRRRAGGVRRGDGTGSAATSPRPIATPRHEVRGEQKGEMGDGAAVPGGGRRRRRWWWREAAGYGGEGVRLVFVGGGGGL
jgi:hypothetical protein